MTGTEIVTAIKIATGKLRLRPAQQVSILPRAPMEELVASETNCIAESPFGLQKQYPHATGH
jgi:hypothetical protein